MNLDNVPGALIGGGLIGLAASISLLLSGRVAGISGIVGGLFDAPRRERGWRLSFVAGLLVGGVVLVALAPQAIAAPQGRHLVVVLLAGLLVGYGTQLGSGCTSGHGVCGITRLSPRSLAATLTFVLTGFFTATFLVKWFASATSSFGIN